MTCASAVGLIDLIGKLGVVESAVLLGKLRVVRQLSLQSMQRIQTTSRKSALGAYRKIKQENIPFFHIFAMLCKPKGRIQKYSVKSIFVCKFLSVKTMFIYAAVSILSFCLIEDSFS